MEHGKADKINSKILGVTLLLILLVGTILFVYFEGKRTQAKEILGIIYRLEALDGIEKMEQTCQSNCRKQEYNTSTLQTCYDECLALGCGVRGVLNLTTDKELAGLGEQDERNINELRFGGVITEEESNEIVRKCGLDRIFDSYGK